MSGFLLDTNVLSEFSRVRSPDERVKNWLRSKAPRSLDVSIVTLAEILRGIELLPLGKRRSALEHWLEYDLPRPLGPQQVLTITKSIADRWAVFSAQLQLKGRQIDVIDGVLAATALEHELVLVTRNVKDLRVPVCRLLIHGTRSPCPGCRTSSILANPP